MTIAVVRDAASYSTTLTSTIAGTTIDESASTGYRAGLAHPSP